MQYAVFTVPLKSPLEATDDMSRFLRSHRVLSVDKTFQKMVTEKMTSGAALESIDGVGPARVAKYGDHFLPLLKEGFAAPQAEESGKTP
ncbi:MAG TPA: hypothetical protein DCS43_04875 [Verrucomicrobia bacterium]|nr:hypothetical protein [Verrucomicrobiota bacterium]